MDSSRNGKCTSESVQSLHPKSPALCSTIHSGTRLHVISRRSNAAQDRQIPYWKNRNAAIWRVRQYPKHCLQQSTNWTNTKSDFLGFVYSEGFHGYGRNNPSQFRHRDIQQISVEVDGQSYPTKPYTADFEKGMWHECYDSLSDTRGRKCNPFGSFVFDREASAHDYAIFGTDLTPGSTGLGPLKLVKQGNLSIAVIFGKALQLVVPGPRTVRCMHMYTEFPCTS